MIDSIYRKNDIPDLKEVLKPVRTKNRGRSWRLFKNIGKTLTLPFKAMVRPFTRMLKESDQMVDELFGLVQDGIIDIEQAEVVLFKPHKPVQEIHIKQDFDESQWDTLFQYEGDLRDTEHFEQNHYEITNQLQKDIGRSDYIINGKRIKRDTGVAQDMINILKQQVDGNEGQKKDAADLLAWMITQGTLSIPLKPLFDFTLQKYQTMPRQHTKYMTYVVRFTPSVEGRQKVTIHVENVQYIFKDENDMVTVAQAESSARGKQLVKRLEKEKRMIKVLMEVDIEMDLVNGVLKIDEGKASMKLSENKPMKLPRRAHKLDRAATVAKINSKRR